LLRDMTEIFLEAKESPKRAVLMYSQSL